MTSALYRAVAMMITGITFPVAQAAYETQSLGVVKNTFKGTMAETVSGFRRGAVIMAPIAIILAAINGVVDILMTTGVPGILTLAMMDISGSVMIIAILISMTICILLGFGMPTTAAYTVVALLVAPTLINRFLVPKLNAHFFEFYGAILSGHPPPIATCAAVAAGIAKTDFIDTCYEALKISAPLFVLPFAFIYHPSIVSGTLCSGPLFTGALVLLGGLSIMHGINYPIEYRKWRRWAVGVTYFAIGLLTMAYPSDTLQQAVALVIVSMYVAQHLVTNNISVPNLVNDLTR